MSTWTSLTSQTGSAGTGLGCAAFSLSNCTVCELTPSSAKLPRFPLHQVQRKPTSAWRLLVHSTTMSSPDDAPDITLFVTSVSTTPKVRADINAVKHILDSKGIKYTEVDLIRHPAKRQEMLSASNGHGLLPQLHVNGKLGSFAGMLTMSGHEQRLGTFRAKLQLEQHTTEDFLSELKENGGSPAISMFEQLLGLCVNNSVMLMAEATVLARLLTDLSWEKLHTGHWKDVPDLEQQEQVLISTAALKHQGSAEHLHPASPSASQAFGEQLRKLDLAVMMGGPRFRSSIHNCIFMIEQQLAQAADAHTAPNCGTLNKLDAAAAPQSPPGKKPRLLLADDVDNSNDDKQSAISMLPSQGHTAKQVLTAICTPSTNELGTGQPADIAPEQPCAETALPPGSLEQGLGSRLPVLDRPSLQRFLQDYMLPGCPLVITGTMSNWPAMHRWPDLQYLSRVAGHRTVPVEVGSHYLADGWGTQLMTMSDFIQQHVQEPQEQDARVYLAQHPLFEQIPGLRADICEPDYCCLGEGDMQSVNAWFGPAGTVTPLHYDPHQNLLAQVVGRKYVRLYAPQHGSKLYPYTSGLTTNSSQIDLEQPIDADTFPLFAQGVPFMDCILEPGSMLFIPPGWWHFVKSLSISFSVSFWWK